ncbi:hypothetical protein HHK36_021334 [Tetracentron sinense]|uniref:Neurochondrin n=1 Tax=Tetracentron sinense TaxID=13715 RepID=A0A835D6Z3_TETSI|nr:hypothetical protein HHK36_021334 [Tetracentron sinense]
MEDCLKLLKGERDEQRLAGLLLATKFCSGDDHASIRRVYEAVGVRFLDRLLRTGMGEGTTVVKEGDDCDAYLQLSVTVLSAFCRVPEIASSKDMVLKIPLVLEIMLKGSGPSFFEECYEFLFLVSTASEDGLTTLYESGGMTVLGSHMSTLPDGSHSLELAMRLVQVMLSKLPLDNIYTEHPSELSLMVAAIARQFAVLHNALKFEVLHLLSAILSSKYAGPLHDALRSMSNDVWAAYVRVGIVAILQNRVVSGIRDLRITMKLVKDCPPLLDLLHSGVSYTAQKAIGYVFLNWSSIGALCYQREAVEACKGGSFLCCKNMAGSPWRMQASAEKLQALILAESMMSIRGESWLIDQINLPELQDPIPVDRCLLLVLESSRVEVSVLLNELAYLKYEASKSSSATSETILLKQRNLAVAFSLLEKIIKLISNVSGDEGILISESTSIKVINGLNETIGVVLEYLQDAKDHGQRKGDDLLASVRIIGSYLAETPFASKKEVGELLEYILSIEGEDEPSPFHSICFLLPMLCQITMEIEGCKVLASFGGHKVVIILVIQQYTEFVQQVMECLIKLIGLNGQMVEDDGTIFLACDTIMNFLLKREEIQVRLDESDFVHLLGALAYWTEDINDPSVIMMASSICSLIFDSTSEESFLKYPEFDRNTLNSMSRLIVRSLATCEQVTWLMFCSI